MAALYLFVLHLFPLAPQHVQLLNVSPTVCSAALPVGLAYGVCVVCRRTQAVNVWLVFTTQSSCVYVLLTLTTDCFSLHTLQFHLLVFFTCVERRTDSSQLLIRSTFSHLGRDKDIIIFGPLLLYLVNLKGLAREATQYHEHLNHLASFGKLRLRNSSQIINIPPALYNYIQNLFARVPATFHMCVNNRGLFAHAWK